MTDGEVLPSVRQMADEIGINMHTVNKAYTILRQEGFVKVDRRRGAFEVVGRRGSGNFANQAGSAAPSVWVSSGKTTDSRKNRA